MTAPRTLSFGNFQLWISDTDSPGIFTAPCGLTQKSLTLDGSTSDTTLIDCDDPDAAAWAERGVSVLSATVSGSGVLAMASLTLWRLWWISADPLTVRVVFNDTGANGGGYWEGDALLTNLGNAVTHGSDGSKVQLSVNIVSTGPWAWTALP